MASATENAHAVATASKTNIDAYRRARTDAQR
jgi:hypothetical protein